MNKIFKNGFLAITLATTIPMAYLVNWQNSENTQIENRNSLERSGDAFTETENGIKDPIFNPDTNEVTIDYDFTKAIEASGGSESAYWGIMNHPIITTHSQYYLKTEIYLDMVIDPHVSMPPSVGSYTFELIPGDLFDSLEVSMSYITKTFTFDEESSYIFAEDTTSKNYLLDKEFGIEDVTETSITITFPSEEFVFDSGILPDDGTGYKGVYIESTVNGINEHIYIPYWDWVINDDAFYTTWEKDLSESDNAIRESIDDGRVTINDLTPETIYENTSFGLVRQEPPVNIGKKECDIESEDLITNIDMFSNSITFKTTIVDPELPNQVWKLWQIILLIIFILMFFWEVIWSLIFIATWKIKKQLSNEYILEPITTMELTNEIETKIDELNKNDSKDIKK